MATTTVCLVNEAGLAVTDFKVIVDAVKHFAPLVTKPWGLPDVVVTTTPTVGAWVVYITERNRHVGASGYHTFENQVPVAYCSPRAAGRLFGHYIAPLLTKAVVVKGKTIVPAKQIHGAFYTEGLITTICHELAEMLCDPKIATVSAQDTLGRTWLVEVCDHVFGSYANYVSGITNCILPDVTTPSFYNLTGKAPFSILGAAVAPFTMTPAGYAYQRLANGQIVKI